MKPTIKLRVPVNGFSFKAVAPKPKRVSSSYKPLSRILYCLARRNENNEWEAVVNTRGIDGYKDVTVFPFTEKSFELKGRTDVFYHTKDKYNHWTRIIRTVPESEHSPGNPETYTTLCEKCVFSGHIVKVDGVTQFDMSVYQGTIKECETLLTMTNKKNKDE